MSAVVSKKKRDRQSASQAPARHSGEGRNPGSVTPSRLENGWTRVPLAKVGEWRGGGTPSKTNPAFWESGHIPWVSPKDMKSDVITDTQDHITEEAVTNSATNLVDAGSVLLVVRSGILQHTLPVAIASRQVALNQDIKAVRPRKEIRADYLALVLKAHEREILHRCTKTGTTVQSLELPVFLRFEIPVAPPEEQPRIVAEIEKQFTRLDAGVAALRRVQANLKRYRAAVLKAACEGRLVPTEAELAKAEGRTYETGEQLLARILADRRKNWHGRGKYKQSAAPDTTNLPLLPEGWTWASLDQMAWSSAYGTSTKCSYDGAGPPVLRIPNIAAGRIDVSDLKFATTNFSMDAGDELMPGDLLVIRTNGSRDLIGRSAVVRTQFGNMVGYASYLIRFRLWKSSTLFDWVGSIWNVSFLRGWIEQRAATSAGQHNISMSVLSAMPIPLPPLAEQTRIVAEVERRLSVIEELEATIAANLQRATRLRQSILQRAFTTRQ